MKVIGKTDGSFIIEILPSELKDVIDWDDKVNGALDLSKINIGYQHSVGDKYKQIISISDLKNKIESAKIITSKALDEFNNIDLGNVSGEIVK